jgi:TonB family protein
VDWALQFRVRDRPQSAHEVRERLRTSPVPPQIIEVPESVAEVPELQHGVMSAPTLPASNHSRAPSRSAAAAGEGATVLSSPTARQDSLAPLIEGTQRHHEPTQVMRGPPLKQRLRTWGTALRQRWQRALESAASQEPNTLTGRIAQQLREPRGVRIALSAVIVLALGLSIVVFARRSGGDESRYKATVAAGTVDAYQAYLDGCHGCVHQADAQAALTHLQRLAAAAALETQFKDLLTKKQLVPPANPNASGVLQLLQSSAPDDAYIPQAKSELAAALKAPAATPAPRKKSVAPKPAAKHVIAKAAPKARALPPAAPSKAPAVAANEVMPKPLYAPAPKYPQAGKGQSGWVDLEFMVNVDGSTSSMEVVDSSPKDVFDDAAMHAVHNWVYSPYSLDGVRHPKRIRIRIDFKP